MISCNFFRLNQNLDDINPNQLQYVYFSNIKIMTTMISTTSPNIVLDLELQLESLSNIIIETRRNTQTIQKSLILKENNITPNLLITRQTAPFITPNQRTYGDQESQKTNIPKRGITNLKQQTETSRIQKTISNTINTSEVTW